MVKIFQKSASLFKAPIKSGYYLKMIYTYFTLFVILIFVVSCIISVIFTKNLEDELMNSNNEIMSQVNYFVDSFILRKTDILCREYFSIPSYLSEIDNFYENFENMPEQDFRVLRNNLSNILKENEFLFNIYLYNSKYDTLVSPKEGVVYGATNSRNELLIDNGFMDYISNISTDFWVSPLNNMKFWGQTDMLTFVHYVSVDESLAALKQVNCVVITINTKSIIQSIQNMNISGMQSIMIIDENKKIMAHSDNNLLYSTFEDSESTLFSSIIKQPYGYAKEKIGNNYSGVRWIKSSVNNWRYVYIFSSEAIYTKLFQTYLSIAVIALLIILIGYFAIHFFTKKIYQPINTIIQSAKESLDKSLHSEDEFEMFNAVIQNMESNKENISEIISKYNTLIVDKLGLDLLNGSIEDKEELLQQLSLSGVNFTNNKFRIIMFEVNPVISDSLSINKREYLMFNMIDIITKKINCITIRHSTNIAVSILNYEKIDIDIEIILKELQNAFIKHTSIRTNIYYSAKIDDLLLIHNEFSKIRDLTKYSYIYGYDNIISTENLTEREHNTAEIDDEIIEKMRNALIVGNKDTFYHYANLLFNEVKTKNFSYSYAQNLIMRIFNLVCNCAKDKKILINNEDIQQSINRILKNNLFDDSSENIFEIADLFFDHLQDNANDKSYILMEKITDYICNNISQNISLSTVAEHFNFSAGYLCKFFKENMSISFSNFVINKKFEKATELLLNDLNSSVAEISNRVGYWDTAYFNRQFKSKYGVTPLQYRKRRQN